MSPGPPFPREHLTITPRKGPVTREGMFEISYQKNKFISLDLLKVCSMFYANFNLDSRSATGFDGHGCPCLRTFCRTKYRYLT